MCKVLVIVVALVVMTGCSFVSSALSGVAVTEYHVDAMAYEDLADMSAAATLIVEGRVKELKANAVEQQPSDDEEGVFSGDGPDLYGTITFEVVSVIKGDPALQEVTLTYQSGMREGGGRRLAYVYEGLRDFQQSEGGLRSVKELKDETFLVFAVPNTSYPVDEGWFVSAHPSGIARVLDDGKLAFPSEAPDQTPFPNSNSATIEQLRAVTAR